MLSPMQESVGGTSSYGTPEDLFTQESPSNINFNERPPPHHGASCTAIAADAASRRPSEATLLVKRTVHVSHSLSVTISPPQEREAANPKKQQWPDRTSAAFARSLPPAPRATAPAPRQDCLVEVATQQPGYLLGEHPASEQHCCMLLGARQTTALAPHPSPRRQACARRRQRGVDGAWSKQPPQWQQATRRRSG